MADFISIADNPTPSGATVFDFETPDQARLRGATFRTENARGTAVYCRVGPEFIEKYFEVVKELQARRFNVATMDWRGQGLSMRLLPEKEKGHIPDFGAFRSDLQCFIDTQVAPHFDGPYVLVTHSMGGAPSLQLLADGYDFFSAAVLCAPMTRLFSSPVKRGMVKGLAEAAVRVGWSRRSVPGVKEHSLDFEGNVLTSDPARHHRFRELQAVAPNAIIREPTYGWMKAAIDAMEDLNEPNRFEKLKTPVRIISAENDDLVDSTDHEILASRSSLIDRVEIKNALHEILMEQDEFREAFWAAFDSFVDPIMNKHTG